MLDFLLLFVCSFLLSAIVKKKSIVFKVCNAVLFVTFFFVILFTTNNAFISNSISNWIGSDKYQIIKNALTNPQSFSYAANSVWFLYKMILLVFAIFYGFYVVTNQIIKILRPVEYELIGIKSWCNKEDCNNVNRSFGTKLYLCFERLID